MPLQPGTALGPYRVTATIGERDMRTVRCASNSAARSGPMRL